MRIKKKSSLPDPVLDWLGIHPLNLPIRCNSDQGAWILNVPTRFMGPLVGAKLLPALGGIPETNTELWFLTADLFALRNDFKRMSKITEFVRERKSNEDNGQSQSHAE